MIEAIELRTHLPTSAEHAFEQFTRHFQRWWPQAYSWSGDSLVEIGIQCRPGGLCYEIGPHGFHLAWGRILQWQAPSLLVMSWQIGPQRQPQPDPSQASEVRLAFHAETEQSSQLLLQHDHFARHGDGADTYRGAMASEYGWPYILACFHALLNGDAV